MYIIKKLPYVILGAAISALAVNGFFIPHKLLTGGLTGIAMLINLFTSMPVWLSVLLLNIPVIILALIKGTRNFAILNIIGIGFSTFFLWLFEPVVIPIESPIVAAVFGGATLGFGSGIVLWQDSALGGLDAISAIIGRYYSISVGTINLFVNVILLTVLGILTSLEQALLSLIALYVVAKAVNALKDGYNKRITVFIISSKWETISTEIMAKMSKGLTLLKGEGAYTSEQKVLAYCVIRSLEVVKLKKLVLGLDPEAFISVMDTREVHGGIGINRPI